MSSIISIAAILAKNGLAKNGLAMNELALNWLASDRLASDRLEASGWWGTFKNSIRQELGPAIKSLHQPIDDWLGSLPMSVAMVCTISLFVVAGIWVWTLRTEFIYRGAPCRRWWCDLRIWATLLLLPYIGVYLMFG